MSVPPPPNQWGPQPPTGGQPVGDVPQWGPNYPWGPPPGPPPSGGGKGKWIFGGIALLAVIAVTVVVTVLVVGKDSGNSPSPTPTPTSGTASDIASANDKGPATIITEDPTCASTTPILQTLADQQANGWDKRDPSIPASAWTPAVRAQYESIGQAMRGTADQIVALTKLTPHRVMRELYAQYVAYARTYADRIPEYTPPDDKPALVAVTTANTIGDICSALNYGSAPARGPLLSPPPTPSQIAHVSDPGDPQRFLTEPNSVCADWASAVSQFQNDTVAWVATNPDIPASQWPQQQRDINDAVAPVMSAFADKIQELGERSGNAAMEDFAVLSAQYRRAYVQALPSYTPADKYLASASIKLTGVVQAACQAVGQ